MSARRYYSKNGITTILNSIFVVIVALFLLDSLPWFDISCQYLKSSVTLLFLLSAPVLLIWNVFAAEQSVLRLVGTVLPLTVLIFILIAGPYKIYFLRGAWRTQIILYENNHLSFKTIEFQMQDVGSLGYHKRTVEVTRLTKCFMLVNEVPQKIEERKEWKKVDKDVNEFNLK